MPADERQVEGETAQILQDLTEAPRDSRTWERFFARFWPYVFALTHRLSASSPRRGTDAKDVAQEVFLQFARFWHSGKGERPRSEGRLKALLAAMARHQVSNDRRRSLSKRRDARRDRPMPDGGGADGRPSAIDVVELQDLLDHIEAGLNPEDRRLLQLLIAECTEVEAAKELGVTERTVRRRLAALRAAVRNQVNESESEQI